MDSIFRKTLRSELSFQDMKVKELAARTGVPLRTLESYLSARASIPPADVAVKIARALNVSVEYLVTGLSPKDVAAQGASPQDCDMQRSIDKLSTAKKLLLREFIALLDGYEIARA